MINNTHNNLLSFSPALFFFIFLLGEQPTHASWLTKQRARRAQKIEQRTHQIPARPSSLYDLKTLINATDSSIETTNTPAAPVEKPTAPLSTGTVNKPTIFDEDQYALPIELQQPSPTRVHQKIAAEQEEPTIQFNFEDADLQSLIKQVESLFDIKFITDEAIKPLPAGGKAITGNKISFRTHKPLSKKEAWDLFLTFLDIARFAVVQQADPKMYRIQFIDNARKGPLHAFIGTKVEDLPDNDEMIRYVYFIENSSLQALQPIVDSLKSKDAQLTVLQENKAFILTDKAYNIKTLMHIVKELDKVSMPQAMSILKLQRADAEQVKKLYDSLIQTEQENPRRLLPQRKQPTSLFFPENTRIIAEPRTNSLILLGQQDAIKKIEDFITKNVDVDLEQPYSPLYVYNLKYADSETIAAIMNKVTAFGKDTSAGRSGGVRGGDKYHQPILFVSQKETNQLIIKGNYEDYITAKDIIDKLDEPQPQVAIELLILNVELQDARSLGTQLRSKEPGLDGLLGKNIKFQTSGLFNSRSIVQNTDANASGVQRLLGNLINLATGADPGNTIISLGQDLFGIWGIVQCLKTVTNVQVVSNPFLVATNQTPAIVSLGETRRVATGTLTSGTSGFQEQGDDDAKLEVKLTPQINSDGMILLDLEININQFTNQSDPTSATKTIKQIKTHAIVGDKQVLALGGLIKNQIDDNVSGVPLLSKIPLFGWLFKNKSKSQDKTNLLVLLSSQIIKPDMQTGQTFTDNKISEYTKDKAVITLAPENRDPIIRSFFSAKRDGTEDALDDFLFKRDRKAPAKPAKKSPLSTDNTVNTLNVDKYAARKAPVTQAPVAVSYKSSKRRRRGALDLHQVVSEHREVTS